MPREARLFDQSNGSPMRALFKLQGNVPPKWILRARRSRKNLEPDVVRALKKLQQVQRRRPNAHATIKAAKLEAAALLRSWEVSYRKETFYNGLRTLLELSREGSSRR
jgi:hypothetical protein